MMKQKTFKNYLCDRKKRDKAFAEGHEEGYEQFKIGVVLKQAREKAGLTQEDFALRLKTKKTASPFINSRALSSPLIRTRNRG
ncbi:MAG: transcriptional regulator [Chloroflexota bacterium]